MTRKRITLIAAVARNGVIGADGSMPWKAPNEMQHFRKATASACVIMGSKTWRSIGKPLAGRMCIVLSRNRTMQPAGCEIRSSLDDALAAADERPGRETMVAGGADVYLQSIPRADRIILSRMDIECDGDTHFPSIGEREWPQEDWEQICSVQGKPGAIAFAIEVYARKQSPYSSDNGLCHFE